MGAIETKTFKMDGTLAVSLPFDRDFLEGTTVRIEKIDGHFHIIPLTAPDPADEKRKLVDLIASIQAIWGDTPRPQFDHNERIEFPDRPGLY